MGTRIYKVSFKSARAMFDEDDEMITVMEDETAFVIAHTHAEARQKLINHLCMIVDTAVASTKDMARAFGDGSLMLLDELDDDDEQEGGEGDDDIPLDSDEPLPNEAVGRVPADIGAEEEL